MKKCTKTLKWNMSPILTGVEISTIVDNEKNTWHKFTDLAKVLEFNNPNKIISDLLDA